MKLSGIVIAILILAAATAEAAAAASGHTTLLATSEPLQEGVTADLYLETKPGTGRIFIESTPLTKIDTQISTHFAKELACEYTGKDCSRLDFFYTIKAKAAIIGGPSAGAAMAALTVGVLEGTELNQSIAITGTINSGNIIGHVGGIPEKIEAAHDSGIQKVLIPKGEVIGSSGNISINAIDYGKSLGVDVAEVFSLDEVMKEFTGENFNTNQREIDVNPEYGRVMGELASSLCNRTSEFEKKPANDKKDATVAEQARNLSRQGFEEKELQNPYAAASFCFGANVRYKYLELLSENITSEEIISIGEGVKSQTDEFENGLKSAATVSDAQILAIILDRTAEARQRVNISIAALNAGNPEEGIFELAFAIERLKSAEAWSAFTGVMHEAGISDEMIKNACTEKLAEAQERVEYSSILIKSSSDGAAALLDEAQRLFDEGKYVQCLHKATLSKSEADALLGVLGMRDEDILPIVERKINAAKNTIARQSEKGIFPIVGYSYYEYSNSLKNTDKYSALLFSEYALEFSNLDIYFRQANAALPAEEHTIRETKPLLKSAYFLGSFAAGAIVALLIIKGNRSKKGRILIRKAAKARKRRS